MDQHKNTPEGRSSEQHSKDTPSISVDEIKEHINSYLPIENQFPVEVFPLKVQKIIEATNEYLNFPIDYIGGSVLYAASVAIGNTHCVELKNGFREFAVLYIAIVGRSGVNKSHPLSFALKPIVDQDTQTYEVYQQQRKEYEKLMKQSKKDKNDDSADDPIKPVWKKYLLADFTPEALAEAHKVNKRGIGVYIDELAGWFKNFNRYSKGSEMEFWLSQWSRKPITIDRKNGEPISIPFPYIPVAGTLQKGILHVLAKDSRSNNGFIERLLYVYIENIQKESWNEIDLSQAVIEEWKDILTNLLSMYVSYDDTFNPIPQVLKFTPEAKQLVLKWQKENTDHCNEAETDQLSGIISKMDIYFLRFALILEMLRFACDESEKKAVGVEAVNGAMKLANYFKRTAFRINSIISNANPLDMYPTDLQDLYNALPDEFTTKTAQQIATAMKCAERTFYRVLDKRDLFIKTKRGQYKKRF